MPHVEDLDDDNDDDSNNSNSNDNSNDSDGDGDHDVDDESRRFNAVASGSRSSVLVKTLAGSEKIMTTTIATTTTTTIKSGRQTGGSNAAAAAAVGAANSISIRRRHSTTTTPNPPFASRFGSLPTTMPRWLPTCSDRFLPSHQPGGSPPHHRVPNTNPLCSTSNRALVLALVVIGASYLVHRRYLAWLARRKERMSEVRRRELVRAVEAEEKPVVTSASAAAAAGGGPAADGLAVDGSAGAAAAAATGDLEGSGGRDRAGSTTNTQGKRKKKGNAAGRLLGVAAAQSPSTDRSPSSSVSPARNRSKSSPPPPPSLVNLKSDPGSRSNAAAAEAADDGGFTLVTPHKSAKGKPPPPTTPRQHTNTALLVVPPLDDDDGLASASSDMSAAAATPSSAKKNKKKTKKIKSLVAATCLASSPSKAADVDVTQPLVEDAGADEDDQDGTNSTPRMPNTAYASSNASSSSLQPDWLATTRPSEPSSCETSISNGPRPSQLPASSPTPAAEIAVRMAKRELDEARVRHGKEIEDLQREVARYQTLSEEAQRAEEQLRREAATTRRESAAAQDEMKVLRSALDQAREEMAVEIKRRESVIAELSPKSVVNGDVHADSGSDDGAAAAAAAELDQLRRDNARLQDELKRLRTSAPLASPPPRSRDSLHHQELNRLREECNKHRKAEAYWRGRSEHGERVVQELAASQTDLQRKLAEVSHVVPVGFDSCFDRRL
jgi:hypothetical protein